MIKSQHPTPRHARTPRHIFDTDLLHQRISDGHSRKLRSTAVSPLLTVSAETRDLAEIEVESVDEPIDRVARLVGKDFDQIVSG